MTASRWGSLPTTSSAASSPIGPSRPLDRLQVVLFDVDHTLLDYDRAERGALKGAFGALGLLWSTAAHAAYRRINDGLWAAYRRGKISQPDLARERFSRLLKEMGAHPRRGRHFGETYLDHLSRRGDRLPGCRPVLQRLRKSYRLGIVTNGIDRVQRSRLAVSGLAPFFEVVVTSQGCGYAKPDPRILHVALEGFGVSPRRAVYVGDDAATDGGAARAAGVRFCWVDRGGAVSGRRPRTRVENLRELLPLLGSGAPRPL